MTLASSAARSLIVVVAATVDTGVARPATAAAVDAVATTTIDPPAGARTLSSAFPRPTVEASTAVVTVAVLRPVVATVAPATVALIARPDTLLPKTSTAVNVYVATVPEATAEGATTETAFAAPAVPFI